MPGRTFTRDSEDRAGTGGCEIGEEEEIRAREGGGGEESKIAFSVPLVLID